MNTKLLILADDFSGALDTSVKFSSKGVNTLVLAGREDIFLDTTAEVLAVNTATRHLPPKEAGKIVYDIVREAIRLGVPYIFKKTDSALRGNIGSELSGALEASDLDVLIFFPAFPKTHRTTKHGVQYYDGVPLHQSCLAADPFNPLHTSRIADIIHIQAQLPVISLPAGQTWAVNDSRHKTIIVYDSETDQDMEKTVVHLSQENRLHLVAGCAGLASVLLPFLPLEQRKTHIPDLKKMLLFVCGSINPVTRRQIAYAANSGFTVVELTLSQQLNRDFPQSQEFSCIVEQLWEAGQKHQPLILASSPDMELLHIAPALLEEVKTLEQRRIRTAANLSAILRELLRRGLDYSIMISGGDMLLEAMQQMGIRRLEPIEELAPGIVRSRLFYNRAEYQLISKSGGFGGETLLVDLLTRIQQSVK